MSRAANLQQYQLPLLVLKYINGTYVGLFWSPSVQGMLNDDLLILGCLRFGARPIPGSRLTRRGCCSR